MSQLFRHILIAGIAIVLVIVLIRIVVIQPLLKETSFSQIVTDEHNELLRITLSGDDKYRVYIPLSQISPSLLEATLLYEDEFFYWHPGFNPVSLIRAFKESYIVKTGTQGASTITMQLARKLYNINSRSISGKLYQILASVYLETFYSKNAILEAYLNIAPYGFNIEGIGAASLIYLTKHPRSLKLIESLSLAILPQSPSRRTDSLKTNRVMGKEWTIYRKFLFDKWITRHPQNIDEKADFQLPMVFKTPEDLPFRAPHVTTRLLGEHPKRPEIKTTLDLETQSLVERITSNYILRLQSKGFKNASVLLVDHHTMEVKAALGSVDFFNDSISGQVTGFAARRSPGSTLKPFVYALAMDQGLIHPQSILKDAPTGFGTYSPDNFDKEFIGPVSATNALIHSRNLPSVQLASQLKHPSLHQFLYQRGIPLKEDPDYYGLSIVLGSAEVSMIELAKLYGSLINNGKYSRLRWLQSNTQNREETQVLSREAAFLTLNMLAQNPPPENGIGEQWVLNKQSVAWKTGTSWGLKDAWAVGIFDKYILLVWIGNFSGEGNPGFVGRRAAGPLFFELIDAITEQEQLEALPFEPNPNLGIKKIEVCTASGKIPGAFCGHRKSSWFIPQKSPIETCKVHRSVEIDNATRLRSCLKRDKPSHQEVFEFWPTHLLNLFKMAGLPRKTPPSFHPDCREAQHSGIPPRITSPKEKLEYSVRSVGDKAKSIPLIAIADADAKELKWFVNAEYLGTTDKDTPFIWLPKPGSFTIQVVDQLGRSDSKRIRVKQVK